MTNICIRDNLWISYSSPPEAPAALRSLERLRAQVATALFAPSFATAMRSSSVSATDRPPRRCLPSPNCHSHWLIPTRCFPSCPTRRLHLPAHVETWRSCACAAGVGWSEYSCRGGTRASRARRDAQQHIGDEAHIQKGRG